MLNADEQMKIMNKLTINLLDFFYHQ
jgi:hypothetical protein